MVPVSGFDPMDQAGFSAVMHGIAKENSGGCILWHSLIILWRFDQVILR
jgi:hypothetical protein